MRLPFYPPNQTQFSNHTPLSLAKNSFFFFRGYTASIHGTTRSETRLPAEHCGLSLLLRRPQLRRAVRHHRHRPHRRGLPLPELPRSLLRHSGEDVLALKEVGVVDSVGIFKKPSPPMILHGDARRHPFSGDAFDFEFSCNGGLEQSPRSAEFAAEICRTLRPGGFAAVHVAVRDAYSFESFLELFDCFELIRTGEINSVDSSPVLEILMKKKNKNPNFEIKTLNINNVVNKCYALIEEEPLKPWIILKKNVENIKYLTSLVDISFKNRYVYVDVGARSYGSNIGSWFRKQYPKQSRTFEVYAIEADKAFHEEYRAKRGVTLLPYAAWVRNETLFFEITRDPSKKVMMRGRGRGMGRINPDKIQGFDFAEWLKGAVTKRDFVVVKMDVEGTEFHLIPRLIQTGAICLIDELFLECHYNRWQRCCPGQRNAKYHKTYSQCLDLLTSLRNYGVLVHQWW
uniref:Methyltransferase type 11 domain-containing protein n=1 Tax=Glycine max TaxID=3847 RepID=A0A0R0F845_SOYBN